MTLPEVSYPKLGKELLGGELRPCFLVLTKCGLSEAVVTFFNGGEIGSGKSQYPRKLTGTSVVGPNFAPAATPGISGGWLAALGKN